MSASPVLALAILAATIALFVSDRLRLDLVALLALLALLLTGILTPREALAGFADPLVIMIAALFVVGGAMFRTGLAERFGNLLSHLAGTGRVRATAVVMLGTGLLSALVSTTGTVALMLPVTSSLARRAGLSPSLLLLPMATGALLGGLLTLIATPPNIIVSDALVAAGRAPFDFFDFTPIGVVMLGAGTALLAVFGERLLPARAPSEAPAATADGGSDGIPHAELARGYEVGQVARLRIEESSALVGVTPVAAALRSRFAVNVVAIRRPHGFGGGMERVPRTAEEALRAGDELDVYGPPEAVAALRATLGLTLVAERTDPDAQLAEVLLPERSRLIGQSLADVHFRNRYGVNVLSVRRGGAPVTDELATTRLRFADTLLVAGSPRRIALLRGEPGDFVVVARAARPGPRGGLSRRERIALAILAGMIALLVLELVPPFVAVLLAAVALVLLRTLDMTEAYREINWESVVLIAAILPMATALGKTGALDLIVSVLMPIGKAGPLPMLATTFALTAMLGQFVSNTATAALTAPVAISAAASLGVAPEPLLMTVAIAASTSFATPVATPANMLVLGPGAYRARDFARVAIPVQLVVALLTLVMVPMLFPF